MVLYCNLLSVDRWTCPPVTMTFVKLFRRPNGMYGSVLLPLSLTCGKNFILMCNLEKKEANDRIVAGGVVRAASFVCSRPHCRRSISQNRQCYVRLHS